MDLLDLLRTRRLLAIVRGSVPEAALAAVTALAAEGVTLIEVSLSGRDALDVIAGAREALGDTVALGAGTVLSAAAARDAHRAGAAFAVTPGLSDAVPAARELGMPVLAGVLTPTDIIAARELGVTAYKVFPAGALGGPKYLRDLRGPFPDLPFVPVGGVDAEAATRYLADGAVAVGVGSPLVGDAADGGSLDALRGRARALLAATGTAVAR